MTVMWWGRCEWAWLSGCYGAWSGDEWLLRGVVRGCVVVKGRDHAIGQLAHAP